MFSLVDLSTPHPDLLVGTQTYDDAGVFRVRDDLALVQTVDYFTPIVDDAYAFGQIAAANALSDVYAMGGTPLTVLNIVGYPITKLPPEMLAQILAGGADKVREAGAVIVGGHSIDDSDPKFGMAVTGICHPDRVWTNAGAQPGDCLVLTKPLGVGVMTTGIKRGLASETDIETVTRVMTSLNKTASDVGRRYSVHACTDVTGFGLLGHLWEMAQGSGVRAHITVGRVPVISSARWYAEQGSIPGGTKRNLQHVVPHVTFSTDVSEIDQIILADSITSGGLLFALPSAECDAFIRDLHEGGVSEATVIGEMVPGTPHIHVL